MNHELKEDMHIQKIEEEEEEYYSDDDLYNITSWGVDMTFRELMTLYKDGDLIKPEIQRKYVWDKIEASRFIESILMGLPVPSIFLASKGEKRLIVDGYQRIMTVRDFVNGVFSKDKSIFFLTKGEKINKRWGGKTFKQLDTTEQKRILIYSIHAIIFEQKSPKDDDTSLYQIFERINTGGRTLKPQEIRNCIYQGEFNKLLIKLNSNPIWRKLWGTKEGDDRMKDIEFILRFFSLQSKDIWDKNKGQISLKKHLNLFMGSKESEKIPVLTKREEDFIDMINFINDSFSKEAFFGLSKKEDGTINSTRKIQITIFDSIAIATIKALKSGKEINKKDLESRKEKLLFDEKYIEYTTIRTTNIEHIKGRINLAMKYLYDLE